MDLVIPGEQHLYLRASTSQERQEWLVALGSAKACVRKGKDNGKVHCNIFIFLLMKISELGHN